MMKKQFVNIFPIQAREGDSVNLIKDLNDSKFYVIQDKKREEYKKGIINKASYLMCSIKN